MSKQDTWLENEMRNLVLDTCYEISLLVDTLFFCNLFEAENNLFSDIGLNDDDYIEISLILKEKLKTSDKFYLEFSLLYDIFREIGLRVDAFTFLNVFNDEKNVLSFLGISDEKYKSIAFAVMDVKSIIYGEEKILKKCY